MQYLIFDANDDGEGHGRWDAMASVRSPQLRTVRAEVQRVLAWAEAMLAKFTSDESKSGHQCS